MRVVRALAPTMRVHVDCDRRLLAWRLLAESVCDLLPGNGDRGHHTPPVRGSRRFREDGPGTPPKKLGACGETVKKQARAHPVLSCAPFSAATPAFSQPPGRSTDCLNAR